MVTAKYKCDICNKEYDTEEEALKCQNQSPKACGYEIGDMFLITREKRNYGISSYLVNYETENEYLLVGFEYNNHEERPILAIIDNNDVQFQRFIIVGDIKHIPRAKVDKAKLDKYIKLIEKTFDSVDLNALKALSSLERKSGLLGLLFP